MKYWSFLLLLLPATTFADSQLDLNAHSATFDMKIVAFGDTIIVKRQDNGKSLRCLFSERTDSVNGKTMEPVTIWNYKQCDFTANGATTSEEGLISVIKTLSTKQYEMTIIGPEKFIPLAELSYSYPLTDVHTNKR